MCCDFFILVISFSCCCCLLFKNGFVGIYVVLAIVLLHDLFMVF